MGTVALHSPVERRLLLKVATLGAGALSLPAWAAISSARGFTHCVASGEPGQDRVMLWTRYVPPVASSGRLRWEVSADPEFSGILAGGEAFASARHDWCVKPLATGLAPGGWYFYRFIDESGVASPVGRTRTLPDGPTAQFIIAAFSCSNLPFGHFNAYAHAAARRDLDLIIHLGDYIYEYGRGTYPADAAHVPGRWIEPASEIVALADYRLRYASYRADRDLQRLHQLFPMIMMWDDHESANDSWKDGAGNHQPETEGDWQVRKAAAMQAYREWLPVSDDNWTSYRIGDLAELFRPETRLVGRSRQLELQSFLQGKEDMGAALIEFRDGLWRNPSRTMLGIEQEEWLARGLKQSVREGVRWQVLAQQVIMGSRSLSPEIGAIIGNTANEQARAVVAAGLAASKAGLPVNFDMWDGYPAARSRLLRSSLEADANLVVLSGDSHNAWAFDLDEELTPAGVELAVQSVTSPGYEGYIRANPRDFARAVVEHNPQLRWADTSRRGYLTVALSPKRATAQWNFLQTVREPSVHLSGTHDMSVDRNTRRLRAD